MNIYNSTYYDTASIRSLIENLMEVYEEFCDEVKRLNPDSMLVKKHVQVIRVQEVIVSLSKRTTEPAVYYNLLPGKRFSDPPIQVTIQLPPRKDLFEDPLQQIAMPDIMPMEKRNRLIERLEIMLRILPSLKGPTCAWPWPGENWCRKSFNEWVEVRVRSNVLIRRRGDPKERIRAAIYRAEQREKILIIRERKNQRALERTENRRQYLTETMDHLDRKLNEVDSSLKRLKDKLTKLEQA